MRFTRTSRSTLLTEDGMHLRQRAEEILALGLIDFALMIEPFPLEDYHYIRCRICIPDWYTYQTVRKFCPHHRQTTHREHYLLPGFVHMVMSQRF